MRRLRKSDYLLGRKLTREALRQRGVATVSAYVYDGIMRYSDPVSPGSKAGPGVRYRVRVTLKTNVPDRS